MFSFCDFVRFPLTIDLTSRIAYDFSEHFGSRQLPNNTSIVVFSPDSKPPDSIVKLEKFQLDPHDFENVFEPRAKKCAPTTKTSPTSREYTALFARASGYFPSENAVENDKRKPTHFTALMERTLPHANSPERVGPSIIANERIASPAIFLPRHELPVAVRGKHFNYDKKKKNDCPKSSSTATRVVAKFIRAVSKAEKTLEP